MLKILLILFSHFVPRSFHNPHLNWGFITPIRLPYEKTRITKMRAFFHIHPSQPSLSVSSSAERITLSMS